MQQSQLRVGDVLDDYCPRERRVTDHAIVAMVGPDIKQTRCTTCDAEHEYKRATVPRQRKKADASAARALPTSPTATGRVTARGSIASGESPAVDRHVEVSLVPGVDEIAAAVVTDLDEVPAERDSFAREDDAVDEVATTDGPGETESRDDQEEGPVHRRLIRATLPRIEGQAPPARQAPDFTIRQPAGRPNRFRPRPQQSGQMSQGNRNGNVSGGQNRGGSFRPPAGRQQVTSRPAKRHGPGRKRSK